jgi:hypothetical protein
MRFILTLGAITSLVGLPTATHAATRVDLIINEPFEERLVPWPITTGVPFPQGALSDQKHCRLLDDRGQEQLLQSRVAATWDARRSSVRWLTIDFIAHPGRSYALEFGSDVERESTRSNMQANTKHVVTGPLRVQFSNEMQTAIARISLDVNRDGRFTADEDVVTGPADGEHYYIDQSGQRFSNSRSGEDTRVVLETAGPVRACVRVDGQYAGPDNTSVVAVRTRYHMFAGLTLIKAVHEFRVVGSTRETQFRDIGFQLQLSKKRSTRTVVVDASGEPGNQLKRVAWQPGTTSVSSHQATYRHFGNPECRGAVVEQRGSKEHIVSESDHVGEWMQVQHDDVAITGSLRWMWQQFPKEWEATKDRLTLHLWSPRGGELDFGADGIRTVFGEGGRRDLLEWKGQPKNLNAISNYFYRAGHSAMARGDVDGKGINKHHEFWLHFSNTDRAHEGMEYGKLAASQPLALATPEWNCSTDVFGPLMPRNGITSPVEANSASNTSPQPQGTESKSSSELTRLAERDEYHGPSRYEAIVDRLFDLGQYAQDAFGDYGWWIFGSGPHYSYQWDEESQRHYADPRRFEYHTYQKETQLWWNYFRSGERKFYDWAIPSENHWVDIAVTHVPLKYQCDWRGGFLKKQTLQMRPGDWSIDSPLFYVRQRDSAEAWLRGCSQFQASYHRTLETTSLAYYITGDERFNDVIEFWRQYWKDLAGKTSASAGMPEWIREQPWYQPTAPGEPAKTWAEMVRDYCPFTSGLRHQMTYFFSLATLYEHTWDPEIGQVLRECAAAYLDPEHRMGVWRTQENGLPLYADAPELAHFWVPALWKYARATQDPRMPDIFKRYFAACYLADPFRENVGRYSDVHIGYAWYFTRNPRHLRPALLALDRLLPNAEPLARPQDIGRRLYNPYAPIQSFTAVPRLLWALDDAKRDGIAVHPAPLSSPQRTAIAIYKSRGRALNATLWGYNQKLTLIDPRGQPCEFTVNTTRAASQIQPFDRVMPQFEVYLHELKIAASQTEGFYVLSPSLELAVLSIEGSSPPSAETAETSRHGRLMLNAANPIAISGDETFYYPISSGTELLTMESAEAKSLRVRTTDAQVLDADISNGRMTVDTTSVKAGTRIGIGRVETATSNRSPAWFRFAELSREDCWVGVNNDDPIQPPSLAATLAALPNDERHTQLSDEPFVKGRFGRGLLVRSGRTLRIPDHVMIRNETRRLFNARQGTVEFFVKQLWDERLSGKQTAHFVSNGFVNTWNQRQLPVRRWTHVAFEWRPLKRDASRMALHVYVDGLDRRNYRSTWWEGYSQKPLTLPQSSNWRREFVCEAQPNAPYVIDEIRVSTTPRYTDVNVELGGQQVFNPSRFDPPDKPFELDEHTALLLHLDGDVGLQSSQPDVPSAALIEDETKDQSR